MSELPRGWSATRLFDLCEEVRGSLAPEKGVSYELYSVPSFGTAGPEIIDGSEVGSVKRPVEPGDVLLCKINPRINRVWFVGKPRDWRPQIASTEFLVLRTPVPDLGPYLVWYLRSPAFREWIKLNVEGATGSHTRAKAPAILRQSIPVPPLGEQRRIVAAIEEQFSRLDAAALAVESAKRRLGPLAGGVQALANSQGEETTLGHLLAGIEAGRSFKCHSRSARADEWGVIKVSAMTWGAFDENENKAVVSDGDVNPRNEIRPGDLLLSRANTTVHVGASVLVGACRGRLLLSDKSMRLLPARDVDPRWLNLALGSPGVRSQLSAVASGTSDSMRNISQQKLRSVRLHLPPLAAQRRLVADVDEMLSLIQSMKKAIRLAERRGAALRRSILERAFRGELVPQDPTDEPASVLLERIRAQRASQEKSRRGRRRAGVAPAS